MAKLFTLESAKELMVECLNEEIKVGDLTENDGVENVNVEYVGEYVFMNEYAIYTNEIEEGLAEFGFFEALNQIQEYNKHNGDILEVEDIVRPTSLAQMLWQSLSIEFMEEFEKALDDSNTVKELIQNLSE